MNEVVLTKENLVPPKLLHIALGLCKAVYSKVHTDLFVVFFGDKAARIASSKTFFKPSWVRALHSTYVTAFISALNCSAPSAETIFMFFSLSCF